MNLGIPKETREVQLCISKNGENKLIEFLSLSR